MPTIIRSIAMGASLAVVVATAACGRSVPVSPNEGPPKHTTVTYSYDTQTADWVRYVSTEGDGSDDGDPGARRDNTVIVQLRANTPIKEIVVTGGLVIGGSDPILDIDGDPNESGGAIRIGTLTMDTVDARRLQVRDTQVVSSNMTNVVAQDNELELSFQTVTVVFVERGASSTLSLKDSRVDRIRILGVGGGADAHLEQLTITRSSFIGTMRIEDAKIDTLVLKNVSLED